MSKKVLFNSFGGKQYSDNPRAISEKLHEVAPDYEIVWRINDKSKQYGIIPDYVKIVGGGREFFKELATCFCYVTNGELTENIYKRKGQLFIQTWHGDRIFKKILYAAQEADSVKIPIMDEYLTDICLAGSQKGVEMYHEAFHYFGKILNYGCPRNDKLLKSNKDECEMIRSILGIPQGKKILLYAPTYRDNVHSTQEVTVDLNKVINVLEEKGNEWICVIRAHPHSAGIQFEYSDKFINATNYPDMADLLLISDMLITDYSSSSTDYIITGRPLILAAFDKKEYINSCREFAIDIEEPGFIIAFSQKQLEEIIRRTSYEDYKISDDAVMNYYNTNETGHSCEMVCREIIDNYNLKIKNC